MPGARLILIAVMMLAAALPSWGAQAEHAVLIREATLYIAPDTGSQKLAAIQRGREVAILTKSREWVQVFANITAERDITGWILDKGVVRASTPNGDQIIFGEAADAEAQASRRGGRRGADRDAMRLYAQASEFFPNSPLAGEALYRAADIRWQLDSEDVRTLPSSRENDPVMRAQVNEDLMRQVMRKFPGTKWADLAAFHVIENKLCGDWQGLPKCPEKETEIYEKYAKEHPNSPVAPEALYDAAWRQSALITIFQSNDQPGKIATSRQRAIALAQQIVNNYSKSDWALRAARLIYMVQQGIPTYGSAEE